MENIFKKLSLCIFLAVMIQLVFVINFTQQSELNRVHPAELNSIEDSQTDNRRLQEGGDRQAHNRLSISPQMLYLLIKKYADNPKVQNYLRVLKKKKFDYGYNDEEPYEDYNYQGKFRF